MTYIHQTYIGKAPVNPEFAPRFIQHFHNQIVSYCLISVKETIQGLHIIMKEEMKGHKALLVEVLQFIREYFNIFSAPQEGYTENAPQAGFKRCGHMPIGEIEWI